MRLSEAITLYLAAAAPFGVAFFLSRHTAPRADAPALALAVLVGLAWPVTTFFLLARRNNGPGGTVADEEGETSLERKVERGVRALSSALVEVEVLFESASGGADERVRYALFAARRGVERFAGLALVAKGVSPSGSPSARETELCRVAGRTGEDLLLAGRCAHRRNVLRLLLHRERARHEMLHALAEVREVLSDTLPSATRAHSSAARDLSAALLRVYGLAHELLRELQDERAVAGVRRLLDAERGRLRDCGEQASASRPHTSRREEDNVRHERQLQRL